MHDYLSKWWLKESPAGVCSGGSSGVGNVGALLCSTSPLQAASAFAGCTCEVGVLPFAWCPAQKVLHGSVLQR